jgi:hypothetical protein
MKKTSLYLIFILSIFSLSSCYRVEEIQPTFFDIVGVSEDAFNSELELVMYENLTIFRIDDTIELDAVNHTERTIHVVADSDIRFFQLNADLEWVEIENRLNYSGRTIFVPTKEDDPLGVGSFMIIGEPDYSQVSEGSDLRVVVIGTILDKNGEATSEVVGAYLDITLQP